MGRLIHAMRALLARPAGWFIALVLLVHAALPLHYYLARADANDERFAWRMFSPKRMMRCDVAFSQDGAPVAMAQTFHEAWLELAKRGRREVLEEMGQTLCGRGATDVRLRATCRELDGASHTLGGFNLCELPGL